MLGIKSIIAGLSIIFLCQDLSAQSRYLFTGSASSDWSDTLNWTPYGVPSAMDTVVITTSTVEASTGNDIQIAALYFLGGTITGTDSIMISDTVSWSTGRFDGLGSTTFMKGSRAVMHGEFGRTVNTRNIYWDGDGFISGTGTFSIHGAELKIGGTLIISGIGNIYGTGVNGIVPKIIVDEGAVLVKNGIDFINSLQLEVKGRVELDSGTLELRGDNNWIGEFSGAENTTLFLNKRTSTWMEGSELTTQGNFDIATTLTMDGNYSVGNRTQIFDNSEHYFNGTITGFGDSLIISGGTNHFNSDIILPNYTFIDGGTNYGSGTITVIDTLIWNNGSITDTGYIHIMEGAVALLTGTRGKLLWRHKIINDGTILLSEGALQMSSGSEFHNHGLVIYSPEASMIKVTVGGDTGGPGPVFFNKSDGVFIKKGGILTNRISGINFYNEGLVELDHAIFSISWGQGGGQYRQRSGITKMDHSRFISTSEIMIDSGLFMGTGFVEGDLYNAGIVDPGLDSVNFGSITIYGDYTQDSTGTLRIDISGRSPVSGYDQLTTYTASLEGLLDLNFMPDSAFNPIVGTRFKVIRWLESSYEGGFDTISHLQFIVQKDINVRGDTIALNPVYSINDLTIYGTEVKREMWMQFLGRTKSRPGNAQEIKMFYGNNTPDTLVVPLILTLRGDMKLQSDYNHFPYWIPWEEGVNITSYDQVPEFFPDGIDQFKIPLVLTLPPATGNRSSGTEGARHLKLKGKPDCSGGINPSVRADAAFPLDASMEDCLWGIAGEIAGFLPGGACVSGVIDFSLNTMHNGLPKTFGAAITDNAWNLGKCAVSFIPGASLVTKTADVLDDIMGGINRIGVVNDCKSALLPGDNGTSATLSISCVASMDPNEKVGPEGVTDLNYITGDDPYAFAIYFENVDSATAPAQTVYITDQLNPDHWDFSTFSFLPITIGDTTFSVPPFTSSFDIEVDLKPENDLLLNITGVLDEVSGLIEWTFTSLDPATHILTTDPLAGFLPPNVIYPEGQADVGYLLESNLDLPSGTALGSDASIIFDTNDPILTNTWLNHIDREAPSSQMVAFSATLETGEIPLNWSGLDKHSGIMNYMLYVSENDQAFEELLLTADTSYLFAGDSCKSYRFYTVAVDSMGNKEEAKDPEVLVTINPFLTTEITLDGVAEICQGDSVLLKAPSDINLSYTWYLNSIALEGINDSIMYVGESGSYTVNVEKNESCKGLSDPVSITVNQLPVVSLSVNGNIISAQEGFQEYHWYINDTLVEGALISNLETEMSGEYVVRVTDGNGCTQISDPVVLQIVNTARLQSNYFTVYPNPANEWITLKIPETLQNNNLYISIIDINAKYILKSIRMDVLDGEASIHLGQYSAGIYNYIIEDKVNGKIYLGQFILQ